MLTPTGVTAATYRNAILAGAAKHARLVFPVQNVTLTDDNISASGGLSLSTIMNPDIDLVMGKAIMSEVVVYLLNSDTFNGFDWTEEFRLDFGVEINGSTYWVTVGYFKGKKPKRTIRTQTIEFIAHDRMQKFDVIADEFIDSIASGTFSIRTIFRNLCTYVGLSYSETNSISDAMTATFTSAVWKSILPRGITCRALLAMIAEVNCCYARITANGGVDLVWFTDNTSYSLTENDYFSGSNIAEDTVSVPSYVRVASTDENISGYVYPVNTSGEKYTILDNPIMLNMAVSQSQSVITTMLSRFAAVGAYFPSTISAVGCWLFETGDIINVVYNTDQTMSMPIFNRSLFYNGSFRDAYECTGNTERTEMTESVKEQYKRSGELSNKYSIVTGVDITDDGIDISGAKYLKLKAGASIEMVSNGVFDLRSENLIIRSATGTIQSWRVNQSNIPQIVNIGSTLGSSARCYIMNMTIGGISYIDNYATDEDLEASCGLSLTYLQYTDNATLQSVREPTVRGSCRIVDNTNNQYNEIYRSQYGNLVFSKAYFEDGLYAGYYRHRILRNQVNYADEIGYDLNNLLARMEAFSSQFVHLKTTSAFDGFTIDTRYYGTLFKGASDSLAQVYLYDTNGSRFEGHKSGGDWVIKKEFTDYGGYIPNGTDLNTVILPGYYGLASTSTYVNYPASTYGLLVRKMSATSTGVLQIAIGTQKLYIRFRTNATNWSSWVSIDNYGGGWLPSGTNIDNIVQPGSYGISSNNNYSGTLPAGVTSGVLEVIAPGTSTTYIIQRITQVGFMCERYKSASSGEAWGSWYKYTGTLAQ